MNIGIINIPYSVILKNIGKINKMILLGDSTTLKLKKEIGIIKIPILIIIKLFIVLSHLRISLFLTTSNKI
jgi:hypothetical protein